MTKDLFIRPKELEKVGHRRMGYDLEPKYIVESLNR